MRQLKTQVIVHFNTINKRYKDVTHHGNGLLHFVCQEGFFSMLEFITNKVNRPDLDKDLPLDLNMHNDKDRTPLLICFTPSVSTFLGQKYGIGDNGLPLVEHASSGDSVKAGGPITIASDWQKPGGEKERCQCISLLIELGADVNYKDSESFSALHYACIWGWSSAVENLIQAGADVNSLTTTSRTPLMYAVEYIHEEAVATILDLTIIPADKAEREEEGLPLLFIDSVDVSGHSALTMAVRLGQEGLEVMRLLLQAGADPDLEIVVSTAKANTVTSPLLMACIAQNVDQVLLLLEMKARRLDDAFVMLKGQAAKTVMAYLKRIDDALEKDRVEREKEQAKLIEAQRGPISISSDFVSRGYRDKSPLGMW
eukprot:CAMPEP_0119040646 /NCGR_PEP_ID=MMETSP1177-20130426/10651_1 /TAXON_ID=2985 /ORGANISM="Ochromonas sp, Strain CCMP1899" /LENGTH=369 /DNA_ID=CAMNT_0007005925 /DNA_START=219 /DNA_END=1325 /DNA_ORIENTATION=-